MTAPPARRPGVRQHSQQARGPRSSPAAACHRRQHLHRRSPGGRHRRFAEKRGFARAPRLGTPVIGAHQDRGGQRARPLIRDPAATRTRRARQALPRRRAATAASRRSSHRPPGFEEGPAGRRHRHAPGPTGTGPAERYVTTEPAAAPPKRSTRRCPDAGSRRIGQRPPDPRAATPAREMSGPCRRPPPRRSSPPTPSAARPDATPRRPAPRRTRRAERILAVEDAPSASRRAGTRSASHRWLLAMKAPRRLRPGFGPASRPQDDGGDDLQRATMNHRPGSRSTR